MAQETPNYIDKAKLTQTAPEEVDVMKDPAKFDEVALRKMYKDRLDKASGHRELNGSEMVKYLDAMKQIEDNIKSLRELRDYAVNRVKLLQSKDSLSQIGDINDPVKYVLAYYAIRDLEEQINHPPKAYQAMLRFNITDKREFQTLRDKFAEKLEKYYEEETQRGGQKQLDKVKSARTPGGLLLVDYLDLETQIDQLEGIMKDGFLGAKDAPKMKKVARERIDQMRKALSQSVAFLSKDDKFAVENYARAVASRKRGEKDAGQWRTGALQYMAVRYSRQDADRNRQEALALNTEPETYNQADKLYQKAMIKEKTKDYVAADKLFMAARDKYKESRDLYMAERPTKEKIRKSMA